jgi:hypothetical protein
MTWREFIQMHMAVLGATEFFASEVWSWLRLLVSSVLSCIYFDLRKGYVAGMTLHRHGGWIRLHSPWSPAGQRDAARGVGSVQGGELSLWLWLDARALISPRVACVPSEPHQCLSPDRGTVALIQVSNTSQIRDGPRRQRRGGWSTYDRREAA